MGVAVPEQKPRNVLLRVDVIKVTTMDIPLVVLAGVLGGGARPGTPPWKLGWLLVTWIRPVRSGLEGNPPLTSINTAQEKSVSRLKMESQGLGL